MTVAACILAADAESALRDADGTPTARRIVEVAWAGGALPIVLVPADPDGALATVLAGSAALLGSSAAEASGPVGRICRAIDIAVDAVSATTAALVWPVSFGWVDAETVTSLIEAHGTQPGVALRPAFEGVAGWPLLVPVVHLETLRGLGADLAPDALADALSAAVPWRVLDLGDPGSTHAVAVGRADLPPFAGPPEPPADQRREWGSAAAEPEPVPAPPGMLE